jgi:hypothetical protein
MKTWEQVCELKGKAITLAELVNFEAITELQKGVLESEDDEDDADV